MRTADYYNAMFDMDESQDRIAREMLESNVRRIIGDCIDTAADTGSSLLELVYSALRGNQTALDIADAMLAA